MTRFLFLLLVTFAFGGCSYFNTFYNVKRRFAEAERETQARQSAQPPAGQSQSGQPSGQRPPVTIPMDKYRKVIETGSKLLENYPKSRWVDDALYIMGISYFRMGDLPRADKKFSEVITIFPDSRHVPDALVWRARVLSEQKKTGEAIELLQSAVGRLKGKVKRADAVFLLGMFLFDSKRWGDAAEQFAEATKLPQSREQEAKAFYYLGLTEFERKSFEASKAAFRQVIKLSRDRRQSYSSYLYSARCAAALGNNEEAQQILTRIADSERYLEFAADTRLELAALAANTGQVTDAILKYEDFLSSSTDNERRGIAFYRLAMVHRDHLHDLLKAKALLDSVGRTGTRREITDSARAALDNLNRGLLSLERIRLLTAQIDSLEANAPSDTLGSPRDSVPPAVRRDSSVTKPVRGARINDQSALSVVPRDTSQFLKTDLISTPFSVDTLNGYAPRAIGSETRDIPPDSAALRPSYMTPAMVLTDSIADLIRRALREADSLKSAKEVSAGVPEDSSQHESSREPIDRSSKSSERVQLWRQRLDGARYELQAAYLHAAEFYAYNLSEPDSALTYYQRAANGNANAEVYWKANLYLGTHYRSVADSARAHRHFEAVVAADSVPIPAANIAREALGLSLVEAPVSPQQLALREAEDARESGVAPEILVVLFDRAARFDPTTKEGRIALMAKGFIYEYELKNMDSARVVYEQIIATYPDSSFSDVLRGKILPPDTGSIFLLTDAELEKRIRPQAAMFEEKRDSTGWPPPEESLRGRRFR